MTVACSSLVEEKGSFGGAASEVVRLAPGCASLDRRMRSFRLEGEGMRCYLRSHDSEMLACVMGRVGLAICFLRLEMLNAFERHSLALC